MAIFKSYLSSSNELLATCDKYKRLEHKKALHLTMKGFVLHPKGDKIWHRPTLPHFTAVPSALAGLTSLFGMGRGGHRRYRHLNFFLVIGLLVQLFIGMSNLSNRP